MHNGIAHLFALGDSSENRNNNLFANELLMWHAIKELKEENYHTFDHSGIELYKIESGDKKANNIYRYKSKFGGKLVKYHDYEKIICKNNVLKYMKRLMSDSTIHN
jgi:lipid II:glycine glycyltransferase (peptidoglycan interpeptide bridge formation enzyme)